MILSIRNRTSQKALEFLKSQKGLPLMFMVSKSGSGVVIEIDDDDSEYLTDFLDAKGFNYEEEDEDDGQIRSRRQKTKPKKAKKLPRPYEYMPTEELKAETPKPWPF